MNRSLTLLRCCNRCDDRCTAQAYCFALQPLDVACALTVILKLYFSLIFNESVNFQFMLKFCDTPPAFRAPGVPSKNFHRLRLLKAHWHISLKVNASKCAGYEIVIDITSAWLSRAALRTGAYCTRPHDWSWMYIHWHFTIWYTDPFVLIWLYPLQAFHSMRLQILIRVVIFELKSLHLP